MIVFCGDSRFRYEEVVVVTCDPRELGVEFPDFCNRFRAERSGSSVIATPNHVTSLLLAWGEGDEAALEQLVPIVEHELHRLARRAMRGEHAGHTLQPTALVNEVYLRLVDMPSVPWRNRAHFFALCARLMRRILVDMARSKGYLKRGGGAPVMSLDEALVPAKEREQDLVALDDALRTLGATDPRRAQVVELRFFGGLTVEETAEVMKVSPQTVMRDWMLAKVWLLRELRR